MIRLAAAAALFFAVSFANSATAETKTAIFAGGCFWCVEADFDKVQGVLSTVSGYTGGETENPSYRNYESGGHLEAVEIKYDDSQVSYEHLLDVFFHSVDPTDAGGQFCDRGHGYTTAIYALDDAQKKAAEEAKQAAEAELGQPVVTPIEPASAFWPAEDYHQNYYRSDERILTRFGFITKADAYNSYREGCGRDRRLNEVWGETALRGIAK
ncbi:peptide-methionine (S)-S-oxide reductase MsrA [Chelativorans salis]|uniref:Peptide methionine sulfoxide reductase MsrA n=1 Tax=Chelativorans salis TaxID=2978478 RepID=A0ABT2LS80_9HYPH|nr:peptide-methionine (S)-S-oxide reductase MsrA [Chelativorans sp. EGI FJ00035]MCT7376483.1 peptide-methionine (S)-S-oxide reductase MsrA [Chelativorans sp. EGI FJ00035]